MDARVRRRHGEVAQRKLDVPGRRDHVRDEEEDEAGGPCRDREVEQVVAEPVPEEQLAGDFEVAVPP